MQVEEIFKLYSHGGSDYLAIVGRKANTDADVYIYNSDTKELVPWILPEACG